MELFLPITATIIICLGSALVLRQMNTSPSPTEPRLHRLILVGWVLVLVLVLIWLPIFATTQ